MALSFINSATVAGGLGTTSLTCNKPTNTANGDIMLAIGTSTGTDAWMSPPTGGGWIEIARIEPSSYQYQIWYKVASSEGANYTFTFNSSKVKLTIATYRGNFNSADPIATYSNTHYGGLDSILRAAAVTTTVVNSSIIFLGANYHTASAMTHTPPTNPSTFVENYDGGDADSDWYHEVALLSEWASSGNTGNIDSTQSANTAQEYQKGAFAVVLKLPITTNIKSYNTNLKANIKSINTNLIANVKSLDTNV